MRISRKLLVVTFIAAISLAAPSTATAANPEPTPGAHAGAVTAPLTVTGFDPSIAAANGYEVRTNVRGQQVVVKAGAPTSDGMVIPSSALEGAAPSRATGTVSPQGTVRDDCGESSVFLSNSAPQKYHIETAFHVAAPAIQYAWAVQVTGPSYMKTHTWGGGLLFRQVWTGTANGTIAMNQRGWFAAYASGTVWLANGITCGSIHPTDLVPIF